MFDTVYEFMTTVPVASPVLRSFIMLAEIFTLAVLLYWVWERIPSLVSRIYGSVHGLINRRRTVVDGIGEIDKAHFVDLPTE
jgi:hypothetical protein